MSLDYFNKDQLKNILFKIKNMLKNRGIFIVVDRHIYQEYFKEFPDGDQGFFELKTPEGKWRYDYFVGVKV